MFLFNVSDVSEYLCGILKFFQYELLLMLSQNCVYEDWYVSKAFFCNSIVLFDISCIVLLICSWDFLKVSAFFSKTILLFSWNLFTLSLIFSVVWEILDAVSLYCCLCCSKYLSVFSLNWLVFSFTFSYLVEDMYTIS